MKLKYYPAWGFFTIIFFFSCASHQDIKLPQPIPTENLPQIGTRQAALSKKKSRPSIIVSLIRKAKKQILLEKPKAAFNTLERALGVDNQDPLVWHLMASAQLMQGNLQQAQFLAGKSNTLAVHIPSLKRKNWSIIADVLEKQGKIQEAKKARKKARE
jgi:predicted Zn-dependent protease